jgi:hypothetical protein
MSLAQPLQFHWALTAGVSRQRGNTRPLFAKQVQILSHMDTPQPGATRDGDNLRQGVFRHARLQ